LAYISAADSMGLYIFIHLCNFLLVTHSDLGLNIAPSLRYGDLLAEIANFC